MIYFMEDVVGCSCLNLTWYIAKVPSPPTLLRSYAGFILKLLLTKLSIILKTHQVENHTKKSMSKLTKLKIPLEKPIAKLNKSKFISKRSMVKLNIKISLRKVYDQTY